LPRQWQTDLSGGQTDGDRALDTGSRFTSTPANLNFGRPDGQRGWSGAGNTGSNLDVGVRVHEPQRQHARTVTARPLDQQRNECANPAPVPGLLATLEKYGTLTDFDNTHIYPTVQAAVAAFRTGPATPSS
jgi:hypothetical protein